MRIEVVADDAPRRGWRGRRKQIRHECGEVRLGACIADRGADRAGCDIEPRDHGDCAMAFVFEFSPLDVAWLHRQSFGGAFQGLDAGHLINRNGLAALFGLGRCRLIYLADVSAFLVEIGIRFWGQPVTTEMRLDRGFF